jgi:single-strand DNA-binding protein
MAPLHRVYFLGNVIQDPEVWSAPNGTAVARCGLAVPTRLRQGDTWHHDVCCIEVLAFGRQADTVKATLRQGCTVLIEGRVQWWRVAQGGPHLRQDKHGFPLIICHYAAIGSPACWLASQR